MGVTESDLVLALGSRFSDRVIGDPKKFASGAKMFHIDIDPAEINKNISTDASLVGDIKSILRRLIPLVEKKPLKLVSTRCGRLSSIRSHARALS